MATAALKVKRRGAGTANFATQGARLLRQQGAMINEPLKQT